MGNQQRRTARCSRASFGTFAFRRRHHCSRRSKNGLAAEFAPMSGTATGKTTDGVLRLVVEYALEPEAGEVKFVRQLPDTVVVLGVDRRSK